MKDRPEYSRGTSMKRKEPIDKVLGLGVQDMRPRQAKMALRSQK